MKNVIDIKDCKKFVDAWYYFQKQLFADVLQNRCSLSFAKIHRKIPVLELLFHKVAKSDSTSATSNRQTVQQVTSDFLQQATSATSNEQILHQVTSDFLQRATSATSNKQILQQVTSDFLQRATSAISNKWLFVTTNFCNE